MNSQYSLEIHGLERVTKQLDPAALNTPRGRSFERAGEAVLNEAKINAPVETGQLRSSLARRAVGNIWKLE